MNFSIKDRIVSVKPYWLHGNFNLNITPFILEKITTVETKDGNEVTFGGKGESDWEEAYENQCINFDLSISGREQLIKKIIKHLKEQFEIIEKAHGVTE